MILAAVKIPARLQNFGAFSYLLYTIVDTMNQNIAVYETGTYQI